MPIGSVYTRAELIQRLRLEIKVAGRAGAADDSNLNSHLQYALNAVWDKLVRTDQAIGTSVIEQTIDANDLNGFVPGQSVPLPTDFRREILILVDGVKPELITQTSAVMARKSLNGSLSGYQSRYQCGYYISGPGQTVDPLTGQFSVVKSKIELVPDWAEGNELTLIYATQPPSLGDPFNKDDDAIQIDLMMDPIVRAVIAHAGLDALNRDDDSGRTRLIQQLQQAEADFDPARASRAGGVRSYDSYIADANSGTIGSYY